MLTLERENDLFYKEKVFETQPRAGCSPNPQAAMLARSSGTTVRAENAPFVQGSLGGCGRLAWASPVGRKASLREGPLFMGSWWGDHLWVRLG